MKNKIEMNYYALRKHFYRIEEHGYHQNALITFTADSFEWPYPEDSRTYLVSSNNKAFQPNMGGYSIFGSAIDGSDPMVRLDTYMAAEKGGPNGWKIEKCYLLADKSELPKETSDGIKRLSRFLGKKLLPHA